MRRTALFARAARDCFFALLLLAPAAAAQQDTPQEKPPIDWKPGPFVASLGSNAEITVPEGFLFADKAGTRKLLELTHNIVGGDEVGAVVPAGSTEEDSWFVVFTFREVGYVKDDEKDTIDPDALLASMRKGTEAANEARRKRGWSTMELVGWETAPHYDEQTHNLTWAIRGKTETSESVNHSVRLLGRRGTMDADLVLGPEQYAASVPRFDALIGGFRFRQGNQYADFIQGDKVAAYGLTALIAGGAGAVAVQTGLFAKFGKAIIALLLVLKKALVLVVLAVFAFFRRVIKGMFSRRDSEITMPPANARSVSSASMDPDSDATSSRTGTNS